jgi:2-iminobutanoate/2-iminopropanoate deaminase
VRLLSLLVPAALIPAAASAQAAPRDSSIVRGDRTIFHEHAPSEQQWGYAQALVVGNTIYVSGTVARGATMEQQITNVYARIARTLQVNGFTMQQVVKETVYTRDMAALAAANAPRLAAYAGHTPAATWVEITRLLSGGAMVEIEVTAVRPAAP